MRTALRIQLYVVGLGGLDAFQARLNVLLNAVRETQLAKDDAELAIAMETTGSPHLHD